MRFSFTTALLGLSILAFSSSIAASDKDAGNGLHFSNGEISSDAPEPLRTWDETSMTRKLQESPGFFSFIFASVELGLDIISIVVQDAIEVTIELVSEVVENGIDFGSILEIVGEQITETTGDITTTVVVFAIENLNTLTNDVIQEFLTALDPVDLNYDPDFERLMTNETDCNVSYSIDSTFLYGASKINIDDLEIDDFSFSNDVLTFRAAGSLTADSMEVEFRGELTSADECAGEPTDYAATVFLTDLSLIADVQFEGVIVDDIMMNITKADFSEIGLFGYDPYRIVVSNISVSYGENIEQDVEKAFSEYLDELFTDLEEAFLVPSTFLESIDVELPQVLELPFEWPL